MTDQIRVTRDGPVLEVVLDRPKANAIDAATSQALSLAFAEFRDDPGLRVAIFTGEGPRFFSAGWDLSAAVEGEDYQSDYGEGGFGGFPELPRLDKPVICAVNGVAVGGGFEIVLAADLVVAADHARFWLPESGLGLIPDAGTIRLPRLLSRPLANEILFAGRRLDAAEALELGVVNRVVPGAEVMAVARELAATVCSAAPLAVATILDVSRRTAHLPLDEAFELLRSGRIDSYERMLASDDAVEGPKAFSEGRSPHWTGTQN
jgi:crotonobetainyl-CoA hydratase